MKTIIDNCNVCFPFPHAELSLHSVFIFTSSSNGLLWVLRCWSSALTWNKITKCTRICIAPECDAPRTGSRFTCNQTSLLWDLPVFEQSLNVYNIPFSQNRSNILQNCINSNFQWIVFVSNIGYFHFGITWWRHQMETFSALLVHFDGNPSVTGGFPS